MKVLACLPRGRKVPVKAAKISGATSKLTGPRYYSRESLRDVFVHGTHFASAVKGNAVEDVNLYGLGNEKGVPAAKIATYKVCELFCCGHMRPSQLEHVTSQMSQEVAEKYTMPTNSRGLNCSSFSGLPLVLHAQTCFICDVNINVFRNSSQVAFSSFAWIDNQEFQTSYFRGTRGLLRVSRVVAWECFL